MRSASSSCRARPTPSSRSTSISRARSRRRTRSTTCSTRTRACAAVLRQAGIALRERGRDACGDADLSPLTSPYEDALLRRLADFPGGARRPRRATSRRTRSRSTSRIWPRNSTVTIMPSASWSTIRVVRAARLALASPRDRCLRNGLADARHRRAGADVRQCPEVNAVGVTRVRYEHDTRRFPPASQDTDVRARDAVGAGGTLLGVFIGLVLGLGPRRGRRVLPDEGQRAVPGAGRQGGARGHHATRPRTAKADAAATDKPRFDFYKILPGGEEPKVSAECARTRPSPDRALLDQAANAAATDKAAADKAGRRRRPRSARAGQERRGRTSAARLPERFWLQAGSFATEVRCGEPEGAARVRRLAGERAAGHAARQGHPLSRAARSLRQHRRAHPHPQRSRQEAASTSR